jgi:hypothetical protein
MVKSGGRLGFPNESALALRVFHQLGRQYLTPKIT